MPQRIFGLEMNRKLQFTHSLLGFMLLEKRKAEIKACLPRVRILVHGSLEGRNCTRQLLALTEVCTEGVIRSG